MKYGYGRVSSSSQDLTAQLRQLEESGVDKKNIFKEKVSGRNKDNREEFKKLIEKVQSGDTIVITKLDRFARSTKDALATIELLNQKGVDLIVLNMGGMPVNTGTAIGKLMVTVLAGIAEFEADMIKERQTEGIAVAKERGVYKGRPHKYTDKHKGLQHALKLYKDRDNNKMTVNEIAEITKISRATIYRAVRDGERSNNY
ncbi:recombinase family protein [Brevibacterium sp. PAMC23299]|nr:recombinase family protein [Brevibacterium sp. PAMC23299]